MSAVSIVTEDVLSGLLAAGPVEYGTADADTASLIESAFGRFVPAPALLRTAIDAAFWASLSTEEGKPALTQVEFSDAREPHCRFEPQLLSSGVLRKLSPLMDEPSNVLFVRKDGHVVGVGGSQGGTRIVTHSPGHLAVVDGPIVLGAFEQGRWTILGGGETNVSNLLQRLLEGDAFPDRFMQATLIVRLAMAARRTGRGATFVLLPTTSRSGIGSIAYPVEAFPALPQALAAWRQANRSTPSTMVREQNKALMLLAQGIAATGAGIDGATLFDDVSLQLLGFGAKVSVPDDGADVRLMELPHTDLRIVKKKDLGGMRHQTAARLVQHNHQATAITVSQDGPISLFTWVRDEAVVAVVTHLDRYLSGHPRFAR